MAMAKDAARDNLAPGMLLAAPTLHDPNFEHSVVLLGRSGGDGALGWVINGRELMSVRELLASSEALPQGRRSRRPASFASPVRLGGPVAPAAGWLIYRRGERNRCPGRWRSDPRSPSPASWRLSLRWSVAKAPRSSSCCWAAPAGRPASSRAKSVPAVGCPPRFVPIWCSTLPWFPPGTRRTTKPWARIRRLSPASAES